MFFAAARRPAARAGRRDRRRRHAVGRSAPTRSTASTTATSTSRCGAPAAGRCRGTSSRPRAALVFGLVLGGALDAWSSALLGQLAVGRRWRWRPNAFYLFGYTMLLKRRTTQNIVWGGLAGCFPALIGWTAVTGELAWAPVVLFLVVFFWTPPHTWALAMRYREDYAARRRADAAGGRAGAEVVARQIVAYSWVMVATSLLLWPVADTGWFYPVAAARARRGLPGRGAPACGARATAPSDLAVHPADAALPLVEPVPLAALRRGRARPAADPLT